MKRGILVIVFFALATLFALNSSWAKGGEAASPAYKIGDKVEVQAKDGQWLKGTVSDVATYEKSKEEVFTVILMVPTTVTVTAKDAKAMRHQKTD
jgi:hypothetical protein